MPTTKTRLNIILSPDVEAVIKKLAARDKISRAGKAAELLRIALEIEEDRVWDERAKERDTKDARLLPHRKAWA